MQRGKGKKVLWNSKQGHCTCLVQCMASQRKNHLTNISLDPIPSRSFQVFSLSSWSWAERAYNCHEDWKGTHARPVLTYSAFGESVLVNNRTARPSSKAFLTEVLQNIGCCYKFPQCDMPEKKLSGWCLRGPRPSYPSPSFSLRQVNFCNV